MSSPAAVNVRSLEVTPKIPLINTSHKYKNPFKLVGYNIAAVMHFFQNIEDKTLSNIRHSFA